MFHNWFLDFLLRSFKACMLVAWVAPNNKSNEPSAPSPPVVHHVTDILVVGAGVSGYATAKTLQAKLPSQQYNITVVESRDRVGGRVDSFTFHNWTLQQGANWIYNDSSVAQLFWQAGLKACPDDYLNASVYELDCTDKKQEKHGHSLRNDNPLHLSSPHLSTESCSTHQMPVSKIQKRIQYFKEKVIPCMNKDTQGIWDDDVVDDDFVDIGLKREYTECGAKTGKPLNDWLRWIWQDYEFATVSGSLYSWYDSVIDPSYFVKDDWSGYWKGQFDDLLRQHDNVDLQLRKRVKTVQYNLLGFQERPEMRAKVTAIDTTTGQTHVYVAQRVILTVSTGVYNHNLIQFQPKLRYSDAKYNPMRIQQYVKIFYQFPKRFWPHHVDYLYTIDRNHHDEIRSWQNLDRPDLFPNSRMLMLTLTSESLQQVLGKRNTHRGLTNKTLSGLTEPLQVTFGDAFVPHNDVVYNTFHEDPNFGYGAYSQWIKGGTVEDYFHFWGGYDNHEYVKPCHHNGCNDQKEWIVYLSGTTACLENWEMVFGAYDMGEFTANLVMESLGLDIGEWTQRCYV